MGFTNQERINFNFKIQAGKIFDANETGQWFEGRFPADFVVRAENVLLDLNLVPPANSLSQAQTNATLNPTLIQNASTFSAPFSGTFNPGVTALRLTPIPGFNNSTFAAYSTYNNFSSPRLRHWIQPQNHPLPNGLPSNGYAIRVFQGDPFSGGTEILTSDGQTGTGVNASVAWVFNYDLGILIVSEDYRSTLTNPFILGFRYIGPTLSTSSLIYYNQPGHTFVDGDVIWNNAGIWQLVDPTDWNQAIRAVGKVKSANIPNPGDFLIEYFGEYETGIVPLLPGGIGDPVYIDPANPGKLTNVRPENHPIPVYIKLNASGSIGLRTFRNIQAPRNNFAATTSPTPTNDYSQGYQVGSLWVNTATNTAFVCVDSAIGNAVWTSIGTVNEYTNTSIAVGLPNEVFTGFFTFSSNPINVKCYVNGQLLNPNGYIVTGTTLQMVDLVNRFQLEPGDEVTCWYQGI
ncbi:MAG: hypothetical protein NZZ41_00730 [Candidatus Dojkabacteria bacterium]|nr:hypothetical protein [Candidatus Dojkabacteria bacterium]